MEKLKSLCKGKINVQWKLLFVEKQICHIQICPLHCMCLQVIALSVSHFFISRSSFAQPTFTSLVLGQILPAR